MAEFAGAFPNKISFDKSWTRDGPRSSQKQFSTFHWQAGNMLSGVLVFGGAFPRILPEHMAQFGWLATLDGGKIAAKRCDSPLLLMRYSCVAWLHGGYSKILGDNKPA